MINTAIQEYIPVTSNIVVDNGIYYVILSYYINNKRKQKWRSLKVRAVPRQ